MHVLHGGLACSFEQWCRRSCGRDRPAGSGAPERGFEVGVRKQQESVRIGRGEQLRGKLFRLRRVVLRRCGRFGRPIGRGRRGDEHRVPRCGRCAGFAAARAATAGEQHGQAQQRRPTQRRRFHDGSWDERGPRASRHAPFNREAGPGASVKGARARGVERRQMRRDARRGGDGPSLAGWQGSDVRLSARHQRRHSPYRRRRRGLDTSRNTIRVPCGVLRSARRAARVPSWNPAPRLQGRMVLAGRPYQYI